MIRFRAATFVLVSGMALLAAGCDSKGDSVPTSASSASSASSVSSTDGDVSATSVEPLVATSELSIRPVLSCSPAPLGVPPVTAATPDPAIGATLIDADGTEVCEVGPVAATAMIFEQGSAIAQIIAGAWGVIVDLRAGVDGEDQWNAVAASCFRADSTCPSGRLAIEIDGLIISAPTVNATVFSGSIQIAGSFSKADAERVADVINARR